MRTGIAVVAVSCWVLFGLGGLLGVDSLQEILLTVLSGSWILLYRIFNHETASRWLLRGIIFSLLGCLLLAFVVEADESGPVASTIFFGSMFIVGLMFALFKASRLLSFVLLLSLMPLVLVHGLAVPIWSMSLTVMAFLCVGFHKRFPRYAEVFAVIFTVFVIYRLPLWHWVNLTFFVLCGCLLFFSVRLNFTRREMVVVMFALVVTSLWDVRAFGPPIWSGAKDGVALLDEVTEFAPDKRMETFCYRDEYVTTPHLGSTYASFASRRNGEWTHRVQEMGGELPDHSLVNEGVWWFVDSSSRALSRQNMATGKRDIISDEVTPYNVFHMNWGNHEHSVLITHDRLASCTEVELATGKVNDYLYRQFPLVLGAECSAQGADRLVRSYMKDVFKRRVDIFDKVTRRVIKFVDLPDFSPYHQHEFWKSQGLILVPEFVSGAIVALDDSDLTPKDYYHAEPGLRGVLAGDGCGFNDRFYAWSYSTGTIYEFTRSSFSPTRQWNTGPILRTINWDCDCRGLVAAAANGVFRIEF
ncbi:MAG: hypothetical protein HOI23_10015 [Deltaproteobacteria bacterium]|nr:hypothetical protein [Deltaproteobacteria bacterium]MBT6435468.1 hypothetical protein [Deltaproteobacteria bacterium]MBT6492445.1 hypothetical protein [Deltaproteobacteria bacterium]